MRDFRGNEFEIGSTVVYPRMSGRCVEMVEGVVTDIWIAYKHPETYKWTRLREGQDLPREERMTRVEGAWERVKQAAPVDSELRVLIQPTGRGSRGFYRSDHRYERDGNGKLQEIKTGLNAVTIKITENIVAV